MASAAISSVPPTHTHSRKDAKRNGGRNRARYTDPAHWSWDERMAHHIHHPGRTPRRINEIYPAHLHINLLSRFQGQGIGRILIDRWLQTVRAMGARGACLGVGLSNEPTVRFYRACGFHEIERFGTPAEGIIFAKTMP